MIVEFENVFLIGGILFSQLGAIGGKCVSEFEFVFLMGGIFFQFGQMGANVKKWNLKMFFF